MISQDLTKNIQHSLKTAIGQLGYVLKQIGDEQQSENILLQLKAIQAIIHKTSIELLEETYRKAIAEKISNAWQQCPGNCGNEQKIERLRKLFPDIKPAEVPQKLKEAEAIEKTLLKFLDKKDLPTPPLKE